MREMLLEIEIFRNWAKTVNKSFAEWETEFLHWERIYHFVNELLDPVKKWNATF
ncbi:hypothetical protein ACIQ4I_09025 [Rummeliibacillus sp. NPDC094406]|uniref:hypothetical protein n=1 Tax=Rummeliibacillus sp. NPDC094406 TaxID=3364511 RepID=UPI00381B06FC